MACSWLSCGTLRPAAGRQPDHHPARPHLWPRCRLLGASSEVIESQVTKPLEDSIAGIDGV
ncbi:MAG: hypothetical protein ACKVQR_06965, partial [Aquabacterium sp.]